MKNTKKLQSIEEFKKIYSKRNNNSTARDFLNKIYSANEKR